MAGPRLRRSFSKWRARARARMARYQQHEPRSDIRSRHAEAHRCRHAASLVPDRRILAAFSRSLLLAAGANDPLGIHSDLSGGPIEFLRAGRRNSARRGYALGRAVSGTDWIGNLLLRGDLFPQSRPSLSDAFADRGIYDRTDVGKPDAHSGGTLPGYYSC